jgi:hypothetical protein
MGLFRDARRRCGLLCPNWRTRRPGLGQHLIGRWPEDAWRSRPRPSPSLCNPTRRQSRNLPAQVDSKPSTTQRTAPRPRQAQRSPAGHGRPPWATEDGNSLGEPMLLPRLWRREWSQTRQPPGHARVDRAALRRAERRKNAISKDGLRHKDFVRPRRLDAPVGARLLHTSATPPPRA